MSFQLPSRLVCRDDVFFLLSKHHLLVLVLSRRVRPNTKTPRQKKVVLATKRRPRQKSFRESQTVVLLVRVFFEVFIIISSRRLFEHVDDWGKTITIAMVVYPRRAPPPRKAVQERRALFCRGEGQRRRRRRRCVQRDERRGEERHLCYKSVAVVEITRVVRNIKMAPFFTPPTKTLNKTSLNKLKILLILEELVCYLELTLLDLVLVIKVFQV